jgi:hypothetical protein
MTKFTVLESTELKFGGANTKLATIINDFIPGQTYWLKTTKVLPVGKEVEIDMTLMTVTCEVNDEGHDFRVIRVKGL